MSDSGIVTIHGREYRTVAKRVAMFREDHPAWSITCKVLSAAEIVQVRAKIQDDTGRTLATGFAEEVRGSTMILKTSALETCETSAVGRALAFLGYGGTEIASADEMTVAIEQQEAVKDPMQLHLEAVANNLTAIVYIKEALEREEYETAYEAFQEISEADRHALWMAPTKGGKAWTTKEIAQFKSNEWGAARKVFHGIEEQPE